jgi:vacuolar-type H+-ATPase subunit H
MKKADILNKIKDAEELAEKQKKKALALKDANLAKAKKQAQAKLDQGKARAKATYNQIYKNAEEEIEREKRILMARAEKKQEDLRVRSSAAVDEAVDLLMSKIERVVNV